VIDDLEACPWHDAVLLDISVDRSNPGSVDLVCLTIEWPAQPNESKARRSEIEFQDCYRFEASMNLGVVAEETIRDAWFEPDNAEVAKLQSVFGVTDLHCWVLETNSTASTIRIIARGASFKQV
jgi:hypothetical protein